ncbi:uncharacterized protein LOC124168956 isoform X2 [Ischnura elegans]|uniref:uncharacterized protein LOC124168956 isoform X2 n=1 Tax=Ischnura elegans TaxID=197161 RepID=UPI001ED8677D|nr:uncharacterized protein LOC124168956 isoform X2 [Ischnura elegans]
MMSTSSKVTPSNEEMSGMIFEDMMCRLCMNYRGDSLNIFVAKGKSGVEFGSLIEDLLNLEVFEGDGLPYRGCYLCLKKLMDFKEFKDMCVKSSDQLRKIYEEFCAKNRANQEVIVIDSDDDEALEVVEPGGSNVLGETSWQGETGGQDETSHKSEFKVVCQPLDIRNPVDIKEESFDDADTCRGEGQYETTGRVSGDAACLPLEGCIKEEVDHVESWDMSGGNGQYESQGNVSSEPAHLPHQEVAASKTKEYIVVELSENDRKVITVAPKNWLLGEEATFILWPSKIHGSELAMIKGCIEPDPSTWDKYSVLTVSRPFQKYLDACHLKKLAFRLKSLKKAKEQLQKCEDSGRRLTFPADSKLVGESSSEGSEEEDVAVAETIPDACQERSDDDILRIHTSQTDLSESQKRPLENADSERDAQKRRTHETSDIEGSFPCDSARTSVHNYSRVTHNVIKEVSNYMHTFKEEIINEIRVALLPVKLNMEDCLENQLALRNCLEGKGNRPSPSNVAMEPVMPFKLPANEREEMIYIEFDIKKKKGSFRYLVDYFLLVKKCDMQKWVRTNLNRTVSKNLAMLYNWTGKQNKRSFSASFPKFIEAFHVAARSLFRGKYDASMINSEIKKWLRNARARKI